MHRLDFAVLLDQWLECSMAGTFSLSEPTIDPPQSDHRGKNRNFTVGKIWLGLFRYTIFLGPRPPPPPSHASLRAGISGPYRLNPPTPHPLSPCHT